MMETLRKGAASWISKILIALLVLSFAIWGINDVFSGFGRTNVATVGDRTISVDEFQQTYQRALQRVSQRFGRSLTGEQGRALGLDRQVLSGLIGEASVDAHADDLALGISTDAVVERIRRTPEFQGTDGSFSRLRFVEALQSVGLTESGFVEREREEAVRSQITSALLVDNSAPGVLMDALNEYQNGKRSVGYFIIDSSQIGELPEPADEKLKAYYEENKPDYTAPEYRTANVIILTPDTLAQNISVTDEDLKARYDATAESFNVPERRRIEQIAFPSLEAADTAHAELKSGKSFADVAAAAGMKASDLALGMVARDDLADSKIADAAFALPLQGFSAPVTGALVTAIVRVTEIKPGVVRTFDDVKDELRNQMAREIATNEIQDLYDKIEDERAGGASLKDIAAKLNLPFATTPPVDSSGKNADGKQPEGIADIARIATATFASDVGQENNALDATAGGYIWYDVGDIIPETLKPFEGVKSEVEAAYQAREVSRALASKAQQLIARIDAGIPLADVAKELGLEPRTFDDMTRTASRDDLPQAAVATIFTLARGKSGAAALKDGAERVVFQVVDIKPAVAPDDAAKARFNQVLSGQLNDELVSQYVGTLQNRFGATVNQAAVDFALGGNQPGQ